jgi:hypothetical protein
MIKKPKPKKCKWSKCGKMFTPTMTLATSLQLCMRHWI